MDTRTHLSFDGRHFALAVLLLFAASCAEISFNDDPAFNGNGTDSNPITDTETETESGTESESGTTTETETSTTEPTDTITTDTPTEPESTDSGPLCDQVGEVFDTEHNLCWEDPPSADQVTLAEAIAYCAALEIGSATNWRVPTISELRTIIDNCPTQEDDGSCGITDDCTAVTSCDSDTNNGIECKCGCATCSDTDTNGYASPLLTNNQESLISSTLEEEIDTEPPGIWVVRFVNAFIFVRSATVPGAPVRCVRP